jgi:hypothetical protein
MRQVGEVLGVEAHNLRRFAHLPQMLERGRLARKYPPGIREKVRSWCAVIEPLTHAPSPETRQRLLEVEGVHDGEATLFGLLFENPQYLLLSGDKVAMRALREDPGLTDVYESLCGRVACSEWVLLALLEKLGVRRLAEAVAPMREHSGMLNQIFSMGVDTPETHCREGLASYLAELVRDLGAPFLRSLPPGIESRF